MPLVLALFFFSWSISAIAAPSFDCHRAKLPVELLICGDEGLSRRDGEMGEAFLASRKHKELDATGLAASKKEQQQWLAQRLQHCHISNKRGELPADEKSAVACLMAFYQQRIHALTASSASTTPGVEWANPQGVVKGVSQVTVRFTHPMVPLGDPQLEDPFIVQCLGKGKGRWADSRNWMYDFEHTIPAGTRCHFNQKTLKTLDGQPLTKDDSFAFSTGGAAVITTIPPEGNDEIHEDQVFLLGLDAPIDPATIEANVHCQVSGVEEKIGVRLLSLEERKSLVNASEDFRDYYLDRLSGDGADPLTLDFGAEVTGVTGKTDQGRFLQLLDTEKAPIAVVQCKRRLVPGSEVNLVWGQGVTSLSGVMAEADQVLHFKVREPFYARFSCQRVNREADCTPVRPLSLYFNAPVARSLAEKITLNGEGETRHPHLDDGDELHDFVQRISFSQPFQEKGTYTLALPADFKDDAGRDLSNHGEFPLKVSVDEAPPLAKFSASFGIIEAKSEPALPVTLRNLESFVSEDPSTVGKDSGSGEMAVVRGRMFKVADPADFSVWIKRITEAQMEKSHWDKQTGEAVIDQMIGEASVFTAAEVPSLTTFQLPKPNGAEAFEVMGIPMPNPGFYVVELASQRLGLALHGKPKPYHVQTAALVTNMAAHFFKGRESSVVWVTALDSGTPVVGAKVTVADCSRKIFAQGATDKDGLLKIHQELPTPSKLPECPGGARAYQITASLADDVTFTLSSWDNGIERWSFNLPGPQEGKPLRVHTVLDRSLFRGGETVHMKHLLRQYGSQGFSLLGENLYPKKVMIRHAGGAFETTLPLSWDDVGIAESRFEIPKEAKFGTYEITIDNVSSGSFRVEAFRVPLMIGMVKPVKKDLVNATQADLDLQVRYLAGGMAGNAPVKVRGLISTRRVTFPDYDGFEWANGDVLEGKIQLGRPQGDEGEDVLEGKGGDHPLSVIATTLDAAGGGRVALKGWGTVKSPKTLLAEMEYRDPNGEILVSSARMDLWPTGVVVGIKLDGWMQEQEVIRFRVTTLDTQGQVRGGVPVVVDVLERKIFSHRKRLLGGFYSYDQFQEVKKVQEFCSGKSDAQGNLFCEGVAPAAGNLIIQARVVDEAGNVGYAHADVWVPDAQNTWFSARDGDRMDLLPEKRSYEPGETATFQVRMPFQEATALVLVAREGVMETLVQPLSAQSPRVSVPILGNYGPNVFIGVLAVRGRNGAVQPTAMIDMGRPAMRLGMAQIEVGWRDHQLNVGVKADREVYKTRQTAQITVTVHSANGKPLPSGGEIALAAVDEGLLELLPNDSWNLLAGMMEKRGLEVEASTAMGRVVGKRHFGKKAVPQGGGGGRSSARELFDTLLLWEGRVRLDDQGVAQVKVPLNDSITSFRIVAVATAGTGFFGTGSVSIRVSRDVVLFSGLPPVVREGDHFKGGFTVRNAGVKPVNGRVRAVIKPEGVGELPVQDVTLNPGEARELFWDVTATAVGKLAWDVEVTAGEVSDRVKVTQDVLAAVPVRVIQSSLAQVDETVTLEVAKPANALPGRGGVRIGLSPSLAGELAGVQEFMKGYPYSCMEQRISKAVVLDDTDQWKKIVASLPSYLDGDGLVKYFPQMSQGSDVLTSYLLAVAKVADWEIPNTSLETMKKGLLAFVQGKIIRDSGLVTADFTMRKVAALSALARYETLDSKLAGSIAVEPNLWPTSTVVDWIDLLNRVENWPERAMLKKTAMGILRSRLNFTGSFMGFSTEKSDYFWWLMVSADVNANRAILALLDEADWREDMGRMMRGSLSRRQQGHWSTSVANAWGVLAVKGFGANFEGETVKGKTWGVLAGDKQELAWSSHPDGGHLAFSWPQKQSPLQVTHQGAGKPWLTVESRAAVPLLEPLFAGFRVTRTVTALERKTEGEWHRGDLYRVRLEMEGKGDMTWVVVEDPVPGGSTVLGGGLAKDSRVMTAGEESQGWVWPVFTERGFDSFRAYYEWVPRGKWQVEYTVRLNTAGDFQLPPTHVEAMYAPEMLAESPNLSIIVLP